MCVCVCVPHEGGSRRTMALKKFQTSDEDTLLRGLYLMRVPGPPCNPSNTGSTCTSGRLLGVYKSGVISFSNELTIPLKSQRSHV